MPTDIRVVALTGGLMSDAPPPLEMVSDHASVSIANSLDELKEQLPTADVLLVWDYRYADLEPLLSSASHLKWIHAASVGVDPLLTPELDRRGITLTNSRGVFDSAIAEYVVGLLLAHLKRIPETLALQSDHVWEHRITKRLQGQKIAVVGTGSIGRCIGRMLLALGVDVVLVGRREASNDPEFGQIPSVERLEEVAANASALVLAAPLTSGSRGMVDGAVLRALGSDGYLVNVGRGALVVEDDLIDALSSGNLGGAALDVFTTEPLPPNSPLWELENVIVSPHMSADYDGFDHDLVALFCDNLLRWKDETPLVNIVDVKLGYVPSLTGEAARG